jgi:hypothetical protein
MDPADITAFGGKSEGFCAHLKVRGGFGQIKPLVIAVLWRTIDRDLVVRSQRSDTLTRPTIAVAGGQLVAVENAGD